MSVELEELYQQVILDHSRRPRNFGEVADADVQVRGDNPACGDEIHLTAKFGGDGSFQDIKFRGQGCAISLASASLMTMKLKGKSRNEAEQLIESFHNLITGTDSSSSGPKLGDLQVLNGVRKFPQRVKCAMLAWRAAEQALQQPQGQSTVSTEVETD